MIRRLLILSAAVLPILFVIGCGSGSDGEIGSNGKAGGQLKPMAPPGQSAPDNGTATPSTE